MVDHLAGTEANHDALNILKALGLGLCANGFDGRSFAERFAIAIEAFVHGALHGFNHVRRRRKVELAGVTDVEVENLVTLARNLIGDDGEIADSITHVRHAGCWRYTVRQIGSHSIRGSVFIEPYAGAKCKRELQRLNLSLRSVEIRKRPKGYSGRSIWARCRRSE